MPQVVLINVLLDGHVVVNVLKKVDTVGDVVTMGIVQVIMMHVVLVNVIDKLKIGQVSGGVLMILFIEKTSQ